jgi:hypothetical protein
VSANTPSICEGGSVTLNATGGLTYNWLTSGGATLTGQTITHSPTIATAYNVTGNNSFGCTSGASQVVLVSPKPTLVVSTNKIMVCDGDPAILTASGTANTYSWDANANSVLTATALVNPTALTSSAIIYTVEGTNSTTTCKNTGTVLVNVFIPILTISGNTNTCAGGLINLSSTGGVTGSHSWNTGSGTPLTGSSISTTLSAASVFTLTANSVTTQPIPLTCPAKQTIALGIYFNPTITAVPARTLICVNESVDLTADGGVSYVWNNNMTGSVITVAPAGIAANFTVTGTDANGCSSTGTVQVKISNCNGINELTAVNSGLSIYPNPNDGRFTIQSTDDVKLSLVNELGQLVRVIQLTAANKHEVNITDLAKGVYFVSGQKDNLQIYQKIVVTK